ncbi:unnamed protein product [marine sediment metagenome]|uniref:Uncharacterized protein n=1 Tax=marine sediment metagenome TaxID=412755 RepID=X1C5I5_9ZZZZ
MKDTAREIGTIGDCLYSIGNRVEIAKILSRLGETKLLETQLEDIWHTVQNMGDEYCIKRIKELEGGK